ncbi:MAG: type II toxin-antitoxin system VapB family antitoxin [Gammaproteobacteria bacterium]|nr:type II toxin-antitoxin system VapB family antitoxin [Gammaproteobacteria bacterium]MCY4165067.1 type II toxin-antitoxin system VapB family antitoxin [Gammaproteobacteria bacterium]MCY4254569.1 type II toxin-antitoxin system VapB family antitoxin [Gammaproteobacteria bacterium]MCY4341285.1 type II toxin-antitoxin system VapB family antitoxin [Gammaproteobacteria bacterium]
MKTTLDIHDELLVRAKRRAKVEGRSLRAVVEEGLRLALAPPRVRPSYSMPDLREGDPQAPDPLERYSWPELRELIYGDSGTR